MRRISNTLTNKNVLALLIALFFYLIFFSPILKPNVFFWGSDAEVKHYPTREYLYRVVRNEHRFPLWSEKVLLGHAIYTDMENSYLNPVNVISILLAGPVVSYKIIHFLSIMLGSWAIYKLLSKKGAGLISYAAATLIYIYSFFHLNHLIHFNLIAVSLLFPLNILLTDRFIETLSKRYVYLQGLLIGYGLLWGHPQTTILITIGVVLYLLTIGNNLRLKLKLIYLLIVLATSVGIAFPQIIPSAKAYLNSYRNSNEISSLQGSLTPELSLSYLFPYIYSTHPYYYGEDIAEEYSYTELYNYIGIVAVALSLINIIFGKKNRLFYFSYSLVAVFLILSYIKYVPLLNTLEIPIITSFRYWTRSVMLVSFAISLNVATTLSYLLKDFNLSIRSLNKRSLLLAVLPLIYLLSLSLFNSSDQFLLNVRNSLLNYKFEYLLKRDILVWAAFPTAATIIFFTAIKLKSKFHRMLACLLLLLLILADYRFFAKDVLDYRINNWSSETGLTFPQYYNHTRIIDESNLVGGMKPLLKSAYTPYGYTQFIDKDYWNFFERYHLGKSPRTSYQNDYIRENLDLTSLKEFGITYVRTGKSEYRLRNPEVSFIFKNETPSQLLTMEEGHVVVKINNDEETVFTTIKYDSNWNVTVDNVKVKPEKWENVFMKMEVPRGEHEIEMRYIPHDLYLGIVLGILTVTAAVLVPRKFIFSEMNQYN